MKTVTLSSKNQIVIPKAARVKMQLTGHDSLVIEKVTKDRIVLKKQPDYDDLIGILAPGKGDPVRRIRALRDNWR